MSSSFLISALPIKRTGCNSKLERIKSKLKGVSRCASCLFTSTSVVREELLDINLGFVFFFLILGESFAPSHSQLASKGSALLVDVFLCSLGKSLLKLFVGRSLEIND
jgi:hypothetical protein